MFSVVGSPSTRYRFSFRLRTMCRQTYAHPPWTAIAGSVSVSGTTVTGSGTLFLRDIVSPDTQLSYIRVGGVIRQVATVPSNTSMTVTLDFPAPAGPGAVLQTNALPAGSPLYAAHIYGAMPAGVRPQHPFAFMADPAEVTTDPLAAAPYGTPGIPQGGDFVDVKVAKPDGTYREIGLLTFSPCASGAPDAVEQLPASRDFRFELFAYGGDTITFSIAQTDDWAGFYAKSDYPPDDDPRFPAAYSFPAGQAAQVDLLAVEPWQEDDMLLLTEADFPLTGEAPAAGLRI